ncbi:MAG: MBL fold metallo-hydrolase [Flavobacteriales bacterium]|nr:MBL fold metallo-hydrolase [Flavobacteriales bacterium]HRO40206.1 MBL fold metallo-hydrolase [Flavobacteriales bacterium]HRP82354.1 MBL fold metallo-hydrolase [Flavobacteriales bacterium]
MELVFLGTGTSQGIPVIGCGCEVCTSTDPRDKRTRSSVLVRNNGVNLLIDAGPDLRQQMLREQVSELGGVLLTHEHMDHISGMDDLRAFSFAHEPPRAVQVFGDARTLHAVQRVYAYAFNGHGYPGIPQFQLNTIADQPFVAAGVPVMPVEVMHQQLPVKGFRIGAFAYITDAKTVAPEEKAKLRGLNVLVVNALRKKPHYSHFNLEEALTLVAELAPGRAFLTHISHLMGRHADVVLPANVQLAHDGLKVAV